MEHWQELFLQRRSQIDQHIPTSNQVQPRKRRIANQVLSGKDANFAHRLTDLVAPLNLDKEPIKTFRGNIRDLAGRVNAVSGKLDHRVTDVGGINLNRQSGKLIG